MSGETIHLQNLQQLAQKQFIIAWPGQRITVPLSKDVMYLGRTEQGNDIIIKYPVVSRYHATFQATGDNYQIVDGQTREGNHKPSTNGLFFQGKAIKSHLRQNGDLIRIPDENQNFITSTYLDPTQPATTLTKDMPLCR